MASLNLHSLHSLHSPPHPSRFSSHFLNTISLQFSSPIPFPTLIIRQFNRISRPYCFNEQMDVPLDSSSALSTTMDKSADLVLDSNKNELIRNAVWVGVATIASKILVLLFLYILFGCWENLIHGKKLNRRLTLFLFIYYFLNWIYLRNFCSANKDW